MRLPSLVAGDLRSLHLTHEQLFLIRKTVDKTVRSALEKAADTLERALTPRDVIAELIGERRALPERHRRCGTEEGSRQREARSAEKGGSVNLLPIDKLIEIWAEAHKEALATHAHDGDGCYGGVRLANTCARTAPMPRRQRITRSSTKRATSNVFWLFKARKMRTGRLLHTYPERGEHLLFIP